MEKIEGKFGMSATVLAYSITRSGDALITLELEYPRLILAELNTHRMLSRNSASSRAIPFGKMSEQLTARPVRFGQANPGMQDRGVDFEYPILDPYSPSNFESPEHAWHSAKEDAVRMAEAFWTAGYHKQVYNRLVEPFQMMKSVVSGTEWANFLWLRDDDAADPTLAHLAGLIRQAVDESAPVLLAPGEWHLPYVDSTRGSDGVLRYHINEGDERVALTVDEAIRVSSARSAAVSFRNVDYGVQKSQEVYERLIGDARKHSSALEHQATPMVNPMRGGLAGPVVDRYSVNIPFMPWTWEDGVSHVDRAGSLWSGNLRGWIQHRKLVKGENVPGFQIPVDFEPAMS